MIKSKDDFDKLREVLSNYFTTIKAYDGSECHILGQKSYLRFKDGKFIITEHSNLSYATNLDVLSFRNYIAEAIVVQQENFEIPGVNNIEEKIERVLIAIAQEIRTKISKEFKFNNSKYSQRVIENSNYVIESSLKDALSNFEF